MEKSESFPIYKEPDFTQSNAFLNNNLQCDALTPAQNTPSVSQIAPAARNNFILDFSSMAAKLL